MKHFPPLRWIFIMSGFIHTEYCTELNQFKFSSLVTTYAIFISLIMGSCRFYALITRFAVEAESHYLTESKHAWISNYIIYMGFSLLNLLNTSTIANAFYNRKRILELLNSLVLFEKNFGGKITKMKKRLFLVWMLISFHLACPPMTTYVFINAYPNVPLNALMYLFTLYSSFIQYFIGVNHLYKGQSNVRRLNE